MEQWIGVLLVVVVAASILFGFIAGLYAGLSREDID